MACATLYGCIACSKGSFISIRSAISKVTLTIRPSVRFDKPVLCFDFGGHAWETRTALRSVSVGRLHRQVNAHNKTNHMHSPALLTWVETRQLDTPTRLDSTFVRSWRNSKHLDQRRDSPLLTCGAEINTIVSSSKATFSFLYSRRPSLNE
jgi:hypothetical protein